MSPLVIWLDLDTYTKILKNCYIDIIAVPMWNTTLLMTSSRRLKNVRTPAWWGPWGNMAQMHVFDPFEMKGFRQQRRYRSLQVSKIIQKLLGLLEFELGHEFLIPISVDDVQDYMLLVKLLGVQSFLLWRHIHINTRAPSWYTEHELQTIYHRLHYYHRDGFFLPFCCLLFFSVLFIKSWTSSVSLMGSMMVPILVVTLGLTSWWKVNSEFQWRPMGVQWDFSKCSLLV